MNRTEAYMWKRKQAGLSAHPTPATAVASQAAIEKHFGKPLMDIETPRTTEATMGLQKDASGTYTQTIPAMMNQTELYFWKREQAGLTHSPTPAKNVADKAAIEAHFGKPLMDIKPPPITPAEETAELEAQHEVFVSRNEAKSETVDAHEYVAHHAAQYGSEQSENLGSALHNLYSDSYSVVDVSPGISVVVDSKKDEVQVIHDRVLTDTERQDIVRSVDVAGDVPNKTIFVEAGRDTTGAPAELGMQGEVPGMEGTPGVVVSGGSSIGDVLGKGGILVIAAIIAIVVLFFGRRK